MTQNNTKFARTCSDCGKGMNEGYVINGGCEHYCSDDCLHKHISADEFEDLYDDGDGDSYWTEWDADDCDDEDEEVTVQDLATAENVAAYNATMDKWVFAHDTLDAAGIPSTAANIDALETLLEQAA